MRGNYRSYAVVIRKMSTLISGHKTAFILLTEAFFTSQPLRCAIQYPITLSMAQSISTLRSLTRPPVKQEGGRKRTVGILAAASVSKCVRVLYYTLHYSNYVAVILFHFDFFLSL